MRSEFPNAATHASGSRPHSVYIGCAGWGVPNATRQHFTDQGSALERYSSRLHAVEINSSFYRPHQPKTYQRWAMSAPPNFRFSVKVPKSITHERTLAGTASLVDQFLGECLELGSKLGGLLVQLPPSLVFDARRANGFFGILRRRLPEGVAIACEPRHETWLSAPAEQIFERHDVNRVAADPPISRIDPLISPSLTGSWRYWRLHGAPRMYYSSYSTAYLKRLTGALVSAAQNSDVWVIFDNTANGHAIANALTLNNLVEKAMASTDGTNGSA
ncbi:MAG: DUF72 domain-containing protein [Luteimonas sp.]